MRARGLRAAVNGPAPLSAARVFCPQPLDFLFQRDPLQSPADHDLFEFFELENFLIKLFLRLLQPGPIRLELAEDAVRQPF